MPFKPYTLKAAIYRTVLKIPLYAVFWKPGGHLHCKSTGSADSLPPPTHCNVTTQINESLHKVHSEMMEDEITSASLEVRWLK